jgi:colanic acid/amylovoran biosynthesis glycosyltransferase
MKIAIVRRDIGNYSETFVRKNIECVNAGRTVVIAHKLADNPAWTPACPTLYLARFPKSLRAPAARAFLFRHGVRGAVCEFLDYAIEWGPVFKRLRIPYVALGHGHDIGRSSRRFPDYTKSLSSLGSARKIIVPCDHGKGVLIKKTDFDPGFVESIPVGIDLGSFQSPALERPQYKFIFVGRFVEKKSPICMLMAFYHASLVVPEIELECIGDGPLMPAAKQLVRCLGLENKVRFLGIKSHEAVLVAIRDARATLQHSVTADNGDMETMPLSIQESLASGTPAIVTDHAGLPEIVKDGVTGYIVREHDFVGMAERIVRMVKLDHASYRGLQHNCIKEAVRFDYKIRIRRIETLLGVEPA